MVCWNAHHQKRGNLALRKRAELSFEIRLFLMEALVTFEINKLETILAQGRELPQTYSHLKILPEFHQENKSVSPCLYFYVLVFYSFVCCGLCCLWVQKYEFFCLSKNIGVVNISLSSIDWTNRRHYWLYIRDLPLYPLQPPQNRTFSLLTLFP